MNLEAFEILGLTEATLTALAKKGFEKPTPIQEKTIPVVLKKDCDIIAQAQTGTGKTAAFGLPVIEKLEEKAKHIQAIIIAPTRELALQVSDEISSFKGKKKLNIATIYGGASMTEQLRRLKKGVDIVVGTPGRVIDHIKRGTMKIDKVSYIVLDEADEMLNMGFIDDIDQIMSHTPDTRRTLLFSATMPDRIAALARKFMKNPETISVKKQALTTNLTEQIYFEVGERDKYDALTRIIDIENEFYGLVFCRTRVDVVELSGKLNERGYSAEGLHGDISQNLREKILSKFKKKRINILVATDVAARGLDIDDLTHVINYSLPQDPEAYVHRIGRTGRAGKEGTAITFITPSEYRKLLNIERYAKTSIKKSQVPGADELIRVKKDRITSEVNQIIESDTYNEYLEFAEQMLDNASPEVVIASVLKHAFKDQLDVKKYREISVARNIRVDKSGTTRLFIAMGKKDGMSPKKVVDFVRNKVQLQNSQVDAVQVFDVFSFVTIPFQEAKQLIDMFRNKEGRKGRGPMVLKAKQQR